MLDITLLQVMKRREAYDYYRPMVREHVVDDKTVQIIRDLGAYFKHFDKHSEVNWDTFPTWWRQSRHPTMKAKDVEVYNKVFDRMKEQPEPESAKKLKEDLQSIHFATMLVNRAHDLIDGKYDNDKFLQFVQEELDKTLDIKAKYSDVPWDTDDLQAVVHALSYDAGLKFRLPELDESCGSLHPGKFILGAGYVDCYSDDTEVLSDYGWKKLSDLRYDDKVAQYHEDGSISFVHPSDISATPYKGEMHHYTDNLGRFDLLVTPNHRMVVNNKTKGLEVIRSHSLTPRKTEHKWLVAGDAVGSRELTFYERFLIAFQADGSKERDGCTGERGHVTVRFNLKKERKKERLRWILNNTSLEYKEVIEPARPENTMFYVKLPNSLPKDFSWVRTSNVSSVYAREFVEEASHWDCHRQRDNLFDFRSTNKQVVDTLQALCAIGGVHSKYKVMVDDRSEKFNDIHCLSVRTKHIGVDERTISKSVVDYDGLVYCLKVPTGMVVVRRNNTTAISGNSGKTTFLADQFVAGMLRQIVDEKNKDEWYYRRPIIWFNNEGSTKDIKMYVYQSLWGVPFERIVNNVQGADKAYKDFCQGDELARIVACQGWHIKEAERVIKTYRPAIVIYDMLDNFSGFEGEGTVDQRFRDLYDFARQMAVKYEHVGVATSQCTGEANGMERIPMHLLAGSRVAKQSAADLIIMIGRSLDAGKGGLRYIHTPKNKMQSQQTKDFDRFTNKEVVFNGEIKQFQTGASIEQPAF